MTLIEWLFGDEVRAVGGALRTFGNILVYGVTPFALLLVFRFGFLFVVPQGHIGLMLRAGAIVRRGLLPGWYLRIPVVHQGRTIFTGLQRIPIEEETRTSDNAIVLVKGTGQYSVFAEMAETALFKVEDTELTIKDRLLSALRSAIAARSAADCFAHKDEIAKNVSARRT